MKKSFIKFDMQAVQTVAKLADLEGRKDTRAKMEDMSLRNGDWLEEDLSVNFERDNLDFVPDAEINSKISLWKGDITTLEIDAIVNAANMAMRGGGGIDGRIHSVAGPSLLEECIELNGCPCGRTKTTRGHNLLCKYILHTVGPRVTNEKHPLPHTNLTGCYSTILDLVKKHKIRSVAFCCISTGIFGYPLDMATHAALSTVRNWLAIPENMESVDRIIFCVYNPPDLDIYERLLQLYFPIASDDEKGTGVTLPSVKKSSPTITAFKDSASIQDTAALVTAIREARQMTGASAGETPMDLGGLEELIGGLKKDAQLHFFSKTLPIIIDLASRRKEILGESEIQLLIQLSKSDTTATGTQLACILACAFLTIMPQQKMHHQSFTKLSMEDMWKSFTPAAPTNGHASSAPNGEEGQEDGEVVAKKAKKKAKGPEEEAIKANAFARFQALLHYFDNLKREDQPRTFTRQPTVPARDNIDWSRVRNKPIPIHAVDAPLAAARAPHITLIPVGVRFAQSWFSHTPIMTPTDAYVWSSPELLVTAMLASSLLTSEILQVKGAQSNLLINLKEDRFLEVGNSLSDSVIHHVVFIPHQEISLPRHANSRFRISTLLNGLCNTLRSIPDPLKIAVANWLGGAALPGDTSTSNLFLALAVTYFELMLVIGDDAAKLNKKRPDRAEKCPELFIYSSGALAADLTTLFTTVEKQEVSYDILISAATGRELLSKPLDGNGSLLNQLNVRFAAWKKEFKIFNKEMEKIRRAKEKEIQKAAELRQKERDAAIKVARKAAEKERAEAKKAATKSPRSPRPDDSSSSEEKRPSKKTDGKLKSPVTDSSDDSEETHSIKKSYSSASSSDDASFSVEK